MKHLVILAQGSTGTSAIYAQLLNNDNVYNSGNKEPLNTRKLDKMNEALLFDKHWYDDHIRVLMDKAEAENKKLVIHIKPVHLKQLGLSIVDVVNRLSTNCDFVHTVRKNHLLRATSTAGKDLFLQNCVNVRQGNTIVDPDKLTLPDRNYIKYIRNAIDVDQNIRCVLLSIGKYYVIDYDIQLCTQGAQGVVDNLTADLGFRCEYKYNHNIYDKYTSSTNKWSSMKLVNKVENYKEIEQQLKGTEYEWMLYE